MKWMPVLALCAIVGCARTLSVAEPGERQAPPTVSELAAPRDFVTWTEGAEGAAGKLVVYDLDTGLAETVATWRADETPPRICWLPNRNVPQSPYAGHAGERERERTPPEARTIYIDATAGRAVRPWPALGLRDGDPHLVDIVGNRALVIYPDEHYEGGFATGELALVRGEERVELGTVWLITFMHATGDRFLALSPDRNHVVWTGPDGTRAADLRSAEVIERPGEYSWSPRSWGWPHFEAGERLVDWLPDSSGRIEHWHGGDEAWQWELFDLLGETPIAAGDGRAAGDRRAAGFSPDGTHVLIHNEEAREHASDFFSADAPPYTLRAMPPRAVPGTPGWLDWDGDGRHWAIDGDRVSYLAWGRVSETEQIVYHITPAGFSSFTMPAPKRAWLAVLSAIDDGRLGVVAPVEDEAAGPAAEANRQYETIVCDFGGNEKFRLAGHPGRPDLASGVFPLIERDGDDRRVKLVDVLTGEAHPVFECSAKVVRIALLGPRFVAWAYYEQHGTDAFDLYAGRAIDDDWRLVVRGARTPTSVPFLWR